MEKPDNSTETQRLVVVMRNAVLKCYGKIHSDLHVDDLSVLNGFFWPAARGSRQFLDRLIKPL